MTVNPLIFVPSVRTIKKVWEALDKLPYDKFISKNHLEGTAYQLGHNFFLKHKEYTHFVICPDDLVIDYDAFHILKNDVENRFSNLAGVCEIDERNQDDVTIIYACIPKDSPPNWHDWYRKKTKRKHQSILPTEITEVGFTGFACQWISRELAEKISMTGGCMNKKGCMDRQFAIECKELGEPLMMNPKAVFKHLNRHQYHETIKFVKTNDGTDGYVQWIKSQ